MWIRIVVLAVLMAGCAEGSTGGGTAAAPGTGPSSRPSRVSASAGDEVTLTGVIVEGLRPSCRVLDTGRRRWSLTGGGVQSLRDGDRVRVSGHPRPDLLGPCGTTFAVSTLRR